jgi:hypothetical protein
VNLSDYAYAVLDNPPTPEELQGTSATAPVTVVMISYYDDRTGTVKFVCEFWRDPVTGEPKEVWSRVTESLAYVKGADHGRPV